MAESRAFWKKAGWLWTVMVLMGLIPPRLCAQALDACRPSPAVKAALDGLPPYPTPDQTWKEYRGQKLARLQALLAQFPNDVFVEKAWIDFRSDGPERGKMIEEYRARHEQSPTDVRVTYLYGLGLRGWQTPEAIKLLEDALAQDAQFPWPHEALAGIYTSPNFKDKGKAASHLKAFLGACPATFEGHERLTEIDDPDLVRASAQKLRELLQSRTDPDALGAYSTLWSLEFKARPPAEYEPLRRQVAEDLKRLRALDVPDERQWYEALEEGYKLANDQKQSDWAKEERQRRFPRPWELAAQEKWRHDHEYPKRDDPVDKKRAYYSALLRESDQWVKARPNSTWFWWMRLDALGHLNDAPVAEVEAAANRVLEVDEANAGPWGPDSDVFLGVAEVFSKKNLHPDRVVELAQKGLPQLDVEFKQPQSDLYDRKDWAEERTFYHASGRAKGMSFEVDSYLKMGRAGEAQLKLAQLDVRLQDLKSLAQDKEDRQKECASQEAAYWGLMGRLAETQNRTQDAMAFYENGLLARLEKGQKPETGEKDELADNARRLWAKLGGTDEGWKIWYARRADALATKSQLTWEKANEPLAAFELADLQGKTWKLADLKGKVTLLNFWATW